jgi:hypothetical protein
MNHNIQPVELTIQIGQLVLEGIPLTHEQRHQLKRTIEMQLSELFSAKGIPPGVESAPATLLAERIQLTHRPSADVLGKEVAASLYNGLSKEKVNSVKRPTME